MPDPDLAWLPDWWFAFKCVAIIAGLFALTCCVAGNTAAGRWGLVAYWLILAVCLLWRG